MASVERTSFPVRRTTLESDYRSPRATLGGWWLAAAALIGAILLVLTAALVGVTLASGRDGGDLSGTIFASAPVTFTQYAQGEWDIYALDTPRRLLRPLVVGFTNDEQPDWSADGRRMLFASDRGATWDLYTFDIESGDVQRLAIANANNEFNESDAVWSPDETQIAMMGYSYDDAEVFIMSLADNRLRQITDNSAYDGEPTWSPDGSALAFASNRTGSGEIYIAALNSGAVNQITHHRAWDENPTWSPDRDVSRVAFVSSRDGHFAVYVIDLNYVPGAGQPSERRVTPLDYTAFGPSWSADGQTLIFAASLRGHSEIYAIDMDDTPTADGYPMRPLTDGLIDRQQPAWWP